MKIATFKRINKINVILKILTNVPCYSSRVPAFFILLHFESNLAGINSVKKIRLRIKFGDSNYTNKRNTINYLGFVKVFFSNPRMS